MTISIVAAKNEKISVVLGDDKVTTRQPDSPEANPSTTGQDGRSAYESAVRNGYKGTEAQWINELQSIAKEARDQAVAARDVSIENAQIVDRLLSLMQHGQITYGINDIGKLSIFARSGTELLFTRSHYRAGLS